MEEKLLHQLHFNKILKTKKKKEKLFHKVLHNLPSLYFTI